MKDFQFAHSSHRPGSVNEFLLQSLWKSLHEKHGQTTFYNIASPWIINKPFHWDDCYAGILLFLSDFLYHSNGGRIITMDSGHLRIEFDLCPINGNDPSRCGYVTKASMRFHILKFQVLRMGKGEGLRAFYSIDHLIMNLLQGVHSYFFSQSP